MKTKLKKMSSPSRTQPGALIPSALLSLCDVLAENIVRLVPFELYDEVTAELVTNVGRRCLEKHGHGYFPAGYLMEVHNKIIDLENSGAIKMQDLNRMRRLQPQSNCMMYQNNFVEA